MSDSTWSNLVTHTFRTLIYVGDNSKYGMKLVNICHGSNARKLPNVYTATG